MISSPIVRPRRDPYTAGADMLVEHDTSGMPTECGSISCPPVGVPQEVLVAPFRDHSGSPNASSSLKKRRLSVSVTNDEGIGEHMSLSLPSSSSSSSSSPSSRRRRKLFHRTTPVHVEMLDDGPCQLPISLQQILTEEQRTITMSGFDDSQCGSPRPLRRLHAVPATVTVQQVLEHFESRATEDNQGIRRHFCQTLEALFHKVLVQDLLYSEEFPQYQALFFPTRGSSSSSVSFQARRPSEIYGCSLLLRLLVLLPPYSTMPKSEFAEFMALLPIQGASLVTELVMLLQRNRQVCFRHDAYRTPTYEELLDWEQDLIHKDQQTRGWMVPPTNGEYNAEYVRPDDDGMILTTPTKKRST